MRISKQQAWNIISILIIVPLGFYAKFYRGPAAFWVNNSLGGLFYEIFWCLALFLFLPQVKPWKIAAGVFVVTCLLECLQLWHPPFLEAVRSVFIGRALIGTDFTWSDFMYYLAGCGIGWLWMRLLQTMYGVVRPAR